MKQISILGATGLLGRKLLLEAMKRGIKLKVLARKTTNLQEFEHSIELIEGNYFDENKLKEALEGSKAILSTIGPPMTKKLSKDIEDKYIYSLVCIIK